MTCPPSHFPLKTNGLTATSVAETRIGPEIVTPQPTSTTTNSLTVPQSPPTDAMKAATTAHCPKILPKKNELGENVADLHRRDKANSVKNQYYDIFQVSDHICVDNEDVDITNYSDDVNVAASLSKPSCISFFKSLGASDYIINTLTDGHKPTLSQEVPSYERRNNRSYYEYESLAVENILELIKKGKVELLDHKPHIVNPLSMVPQRNKIRFVIDCSYLNQFVEVPKFKYEDVKEALNYFKEGSSMILWDLKNGYHAIKIHPEFRKYLGFKFTHEGKTKYAQYAVGPFGLRDLPYLFTKIFRVLVRHWRSIGLSVVKFLDDGICFSDTDQEGEKASEHIRKDLLKAGAFWSIKKSTWTPTKKCEWLGLIWDSNSPSIAAAPHRINKIKDTCKSLLDVKSVHIKQLASFTGQIISLSEVVGNCSRLTTRCSQIAIASAPSWDCQISLSNEIQGEIKFWSENIDTLNIKCFKTQNPPSSINIISSDASSSGCGSILNTDTKALRLFSEFERLQHSTYRELIAVSHALHSFLPKIMHSKVKFFVDNKSAARILDVGSMKPQLHSIAMDVFFLCIKNGICLEVEWIPRTLNEAADKVSREANVVDTDDWALTRPFFNILDKRWGPLTIDCFANVYNAKTDRFYSLFHAPNSAGIDAFSFNWANENCLLVPPVCVVGSVLKHLKLCKAKGVLVVPYWPSAAFWPLLLTDYKRYILDFIVVKGNVVLEHGHNENSLLGSKNFLGKVTAIKLDCS